MPVPGGVCAVGGVLFVVLIGWCSITADRAKHDTSKVLFELRDDFHRLV